MRQTFKDGFVIVINHETILVSSCGQMWTPYLIMLLFLWTAQSRSVSSRHCVTCEFSLINIKL